MVNLLHCKNKKQRGDVGSDDYILYRLEHGVTADEWTDAGLGARRARAFIVRDPGGVKLVGSCPTALRR